MSPLRQLWNKATEPDIFELQNVASFINIDEFCRFVYILERMTFAAADHEITARLHASPKNFIHFTNIVKNNMPKRNKKGHQETEQGGRPPDLTLASFLSGSLAPQTSDPSEDSRASTSKQEPDFNLALEEEQTGTATLGFFVKRTKKGKLPISYENRAKGKKVTVISNVTGDPGILLQELKRKIGAGGVVRGDCVEIQGDHQVVVESYLQSHKSCLK